MKPSVTPRIKAVLFDLDKTLVDMGYYIDWSNARKSMVKVYFKYGVTAATVVQYKNPFLLFSNMYAELTRIFPQEKIMKIQKEASRVLEEYEMKMLKRTRVERTPGCLNVLKSLKNRKIKIGVISLNGGQVVHEVLKITGIGDYVDASFARDSEGRSKPYPDHIINCLNDLKCEAKNAIMVGDSILDVLAAKSCGVYFVGIPTGSFVEEELMEAGANRTIRTLNELLNIIAEADRVN